VQVWTILKGFPLDMFKKCACMGGHVPLHIVLPSLNKHYHLLTFLSFIAQSSHTSKICLWISAGWTFLGFKNHITDCTPQAVGNSIFMFSFNYYSGSGGYDSVPDNTRSPWCTEEDWTSQEMHVLTAWPLYAISSYFTNVPCTLNSVTTTSSLSFPIYNLLNIIQ
jgi:hypothetical protein